MYNKKEYIPTHITTATTNQVFTGKGILHGIRVNSTAATILGIYDSAVGTQTGTVALVKASIAEGYQEFDCVIANGLYITNGVGDYTVLWTK